MPRDSSGEDLGGFQQAGAVAASLVDQVAEAAIRRAEADGDHAKAERLRAIYDQHLASREHREAA